MASNHKSAVEPAVLRALQEQTTTLAHELATWARQRVVVIVENVEDGSPNNTSTIDTGGGGAVRPIEIRLNTQFVAGIRNVDTALRMWTGLALHQLGRVLFPAVAQHAAAASEPGLGPVFRLLDDEQNERLGTARDPKWGQGARSAVSFMLRNQAVLDELGGQPATAADREPTYAARVSAFGSDLRRHLAITNDEHAKRALSLVPADLKDLSKDELLALARSIKAILSEGITFPTATQAQPTTARPAGNATTGTTGDNQPEDGEDDVDLDEHRSFKQWWNDLFRTKKSYILFGASTVLVATVLLALFGVDFLNALFWAIVAGAVGVIAVIAGLIVLVKSGALSGIGAALGRLFQRRPRRPSSGRGVVRDFFGRLGDGLKAFFGFFIITIPVGIWRRAGWLRRFWYWLGEVGPSGTGRVSMACGELWYNTKLTVRRMWKKPGTRVVLVSLPVALIIAMVIGVWYVGVQEQPVALVAAEIAVILGTAGLLFWKRNDILNLLIDDVTAGDAADYELLQDSYIDRRTLEFDRITAVATVSVDAEVAGRLDGQVSTAAATLRSQLEEAGFVIREKEETEDGDEVGDNAADVVTGSIDIMTDEESAPHAQMHVGVGFDCSRSNGQKSGTATEGEKFARGQRFAYMLDRALKGLPGVSSRLFGYTDDVMLDCGTAGDGRVSGLTPTGGGNNDAGALQFLADDTTRNQAKPLNVLVLISDGLLANCSWGSLNHLAATLRRRGFVVIPVFVDKIENPAIEGEFIDLNEKSLQDAALQLARIIKGQVAE